MKTVIRWKKEKNQSDQKRLVVEKSQPPQRFVVPKKKGG
jgi:hypothetical protein